MFFKSLSFSEKLKLLVKKAYSLFNNSFYWQKNTVDRSKYDQLICNYIKKIPYLYKIEK